MSVTPVFDPLRDGISDEEFLSLVAGLEKQGATWFTADQLYAQACAQDAIRSRVVGFLWFGAGLLGAVGLTCAPVGALIDLPLLGFAGLAAMLLSMAVFMVAWLMPNPIPPYATLQRWLEKWTAAGRSLPHLVTEPRLEDDNAAQALLRTSPGRVERVLVVQHDLLVDVMVRNGLPDRLSALVMSERGYPEAARQRADGILRDDPRLTVFLLHDSDATGVGMRSRFAASPPILCENRRVVDLGLFPYEARAMDLLEPVSPRARRYRIPLGLLPWKTMVTALCRAMQEGTSLAQAAIRSGKDL